MGEGIAAMRRRAQGSLEFTIITVTMLLAFAGLFLFMEYQFQQAQISREQALVQNIITHFESEVELAALAGEGYERVFYMPQTVAGVPYDIYLHLNQSPGRDEFILEYEGERHIRFIPYDLTGQFIEGGEGYNTSVKKGYFCIRGGIPIELIERGSEANCEE